MNILSDVSALESQEIGQEASISSSQETGKDEAYIK